MFSRTIQRIIDDRTLALSVVLFFAAAVYANSFLNDFVIDDHLFITDWPLIRSLSNVPQFFGPHNQPAGEEGVYSPLKTLIHALNYQLWGSFPVGYHLVALTVHLLSVAGVYLVTRLLVAEKSVGFVTALLFAVHPVHADAITFMTASVDTAGVMFLFFSFYFYLSALRDIASSDYAMQKGIHAHYLSDNYFCALFFGVLAVFTHELCMALPLLLFLYEICFTVNNRRGMGVALYRTLPFFAIGIVYVVLKWQVLGTIARGDYLAGSFYLTRLVIIKAYALYVQTLFVPLTLAVNRMIAPGIYAVNVQDFDGKAVVGQSIFDPQTFLSAFLLLSIVAYGAYSFRRRRLVSFCIFFFFVSLLPVSNIIPIESYYGERYLYPGSFAFCLLLAHLLTAAFRGNEQGAPAAGPDFSRAGRFLGTLAVVALVMVYSGRTILRNMDWRNDVTFGLAEVNANPESPFLRHYLGTVLLQRGMPDGAARQFEAAVALRPAQADNYFFLGEAYRRMEKFDFAETVLKQAVALKEDFPEAHDDLALVEHFLGKDEEAQKSLTRALQWYKKQNRLEEADESRRQFLRLMHNPME